MSAVTCAGERDVRAVMDQLQPVDEKVFVLAQGDGRPPVLPALVLAARVERRAEKAE